MKKYIFKLSEEKWTELLFFLISVLCIDRYKNWFHWIKTFQKLSLLGVLFYHHRLVCLHRPSIALKISVSEINTTNFWVLFYLHDEPANAWWFVKHSRDIKTLHLVQWLCNHSHKLLLALLWKFGWCCSLERPANIEKSAEALLLSGRNGKSVLSAWCLVNALDSVCPSVNLKRKEMWHTGVGLFFLFIFTCKMCLSYFSCIWSFIFRWQAVAAKRKKPHSFI